MQVRLQSREREKSWVWNLAVVPTAAKTKGLVTLVCFAPRLPCCAPGKPPGRLCSSLPGASRGRCLVEVFDRCLSE